jgi:hypothetical protein
MPFLVRTTYPLFTKRSTALCKIGSER